jgi:hypothetical protein
VNSEVSDVERPRRLDPADGRLEPVAPPTAVLRKVLDSYCARFRTTTADASVAAPSAARTMLSHRMDAAPPDGPSPARGSAADPAAAPLAGGVATLAAGAVAGAALTTGAGVAVVAGDSTVAVAVTGVAVAPVDVGSGVRVGAMVLVGATVVFVTVGAACTMTVPDMAAPPGAPCTRQ